MSEPKHKKQQKQQRPARSQQQNTSASPRPRTTIPETRAKRQSAA